MAICTMPAKGSWITVLLRYKYCILSAKQSLLGLIFYSVAKIILAQLHAMVVLASARHQAHMKVPYSPSPVHFLNE